MLAMKQQGKAMARKLIDISFQAKRIRARVISRYMRDNGFPFCVCFSCGNASKALKSEGVPTVAIAPHGDMVARRWWPMAEIRRTWPTAFDATSGQLPVDVLLLLAAEYRVAFEWLFNGDDEFVIPTGSGETVLCLKIAFPNVHFVAQWRFGDPACEPCSAQPLNPLVRAVIPFEILDKEETCKILKESPKTIG